MFDQRAISRSIRPRSGQPRPIQPRPIQPRPIQPRPIQPSSLAHWASRQSWAEAAYEEIRAHPDAEIIADHLRAVRRPDGSRGFGITTMQLIRDHVFFEEHPLSDGWDGIVHRRYDASADIADAWFRLRAGRWRPTDLALLEHEYAEARFYADHPGVTYEEAHRAANEVSDWQSQIMSGAAGPATC